MDEEQETWQNAALKEARQIGEILKQRYNMQPSVDDNGYILPPPTFSDVKLIELGKSTQVY